MRDRSVPRSWSLRGRRRVSTLPLAEALADKGIASVSRIDQRELQQRLLDLRVSINPKSGSTDLERAIAGTAQNIGLAQIAGAKVVFHDMDARRNPAGLPDILMIVGKTLYFVECKPRIEKLAPAQEAWQEALAGVEELVYGVVRPADYEAFAKEVMSQSIVDAGVLPKKDSDEA